MFKTIETDIKNIHLIGQEGGTRNIPPLSLWAGSHNFTSFWVRSLHPLFPSAAPFPVLHRHHKMRGCMQYVCIHGIKVGLIKTFTKGVKTMCPDSP